MNANAVTETAHAICICLRGCVQGQGVRPTICRLANELQLHGQVANTLGGVEIEVQGSRGTINDFLTRLRSTFPASVNVEAISRHEVQVRGYTEFTMAVDDQAGPLATQVPTDVATCSECMAEVADSTNRRYGYALTSCVTCGPRYTIIRSMPYDRHETVMGDFPFCPACQREYRSSNDRRFHAQASSCPVCGPGISFVDSSGNRVETAADVILRSVQTLHDGKIVALRGIGGYQLLADATDENAVRRLRDRKGRRAKPLAVMVDSIDGANRLAILQDAERETLVAPANPIVLVKARSNSTLAYSIHPGLDVVGLLLPTTALHALILQNVQRPLVCTSGNREGDPLEIDPQQAEERLSGIADAWLHHDRPIVQAVDDSVVRVIAERRTTIRLARGMAPLPLDLSINKPTIAVGGFLKSAIAWSNGTQSALGHHIGDHQTMKTRQRFVAQVEEAQQLYRFEAESIVHDDHPSYYSTDWSRSSNLECLGTQHHHAHVVAGMLEHGWLDRTVMGVAWDGTGYGSNGTIWGGEFLVARSDSFQRVGSLRPFCLPGGEAAIHQPWRVALAMLVDSVRPLPLDAFAPGINAKLKSSIQKIAKDPKYSPTTTSAGRLFDATAAIILGVEEAQFDGQPAMMLEAVADRSATGRYEFPVRDGETFELDWRPLFRQLLADQQRGTSASTVAMRFHRSIATGIVKACRWRTELPVVFMGGVFQNRLLVELIWEMMDANGRLLGLPGSIPPNDGGLPAGQLAIAAAKENYTCV